MTYRKERVKIWQIDTEGKDVESLLVVAAVEAFQVRSSAHQVVDLDMKLSPPDLPTHLLRSKGTLSPGSSGQPFAGNKRKAKLLWWHVEYSLDFSSPESFCMIVDLISCALPCPCTSLSLPFQGSAKFYVLKNNNVTQVQPQGIDS